MDFKNKLKEIKAKFFFSEEPAQPAPTDPTTPVEVKQSSDYETSEGAILSIDNLEVGGIVLKDGMPVDDGSYLLKDGTRMTTKNGVIDTIEKPQSVAPVTVDEEMKKQLETMQAKFAAIQNDSKKIDALKEKIEKQTETIKMLFSALELLGEQSQTKPLESQKDWDKMSVLERRRHFKIN